MLEHEIGRHRRAHVRHPPGKGPLPQSWTTRAGQATHKQLPNHVFRRSAVASGVSRTVQSMTSGRPDRCAADDRRDYGDEVRLEFMPGATPTARRRYRALRSCRTHAGPRAEAFTGAALLPALERHLREQPYSRRRESWVGVLGTPWENANRPRWVTAARRTGRHHRPFIATSRTRVG